MKNEKMLLAMNEIDEKYITEAYADNIRKRFKGRTFAYVAASILVIITIINLVLFLPFPTKPNTSEYKDNKYYNVIQKLETVNHIAPKHKNMFDFIVTKLFEKDEDLFYGPSFGPIRGDSTLNSSQYVEITDNQVAGVIEGDLIKRSDKYIYYCNGRQLKIFTIEEEDSKEVGTFNIADFKLLWTYYEEKVEFYLSQDCNTITLLIPYKTAETYIITLDVSNPAEIREINTIILSGTYVSSRLTDGKLIVVTNVAINSNADYSNEKEFIPYINTGSGLQFLPPEKIFVPESVSETRYTVIYNFNETDMVLDDSYAFLSFSQNIYVTEETIYTMHSFYDENVKMFSTENTAITEISAISYKNDKFELLGSIIVEGSVKDKYSLDEYKDVLRVVTTTDKNKSKDILRDGNLYTQIVLDDTTRTSASLYCIDVNTWKIIAQVNNFAPLDETVKSVRFDKEYAYVCTAKQLIDPVFFFDLSDLNNITYKDTGTISGFSTSLVNLGDGLLLGIGLESFGRLKIEIYKESEDRVISVDSFEKTASYSSFYKSYLIDRENKFIGMGIRYNQADYYILLQFNSNELVKLIEVPLKGSYDFTRAVYIDGYLYMFSVDDFKVVK